MFYLAKFIVQTSNPNVKCDHGMAGGMPTVMWSKKYSPFEI